MRFQFIPNKPCTRSAPTEKPSTNPRQGVLALTIKHTVEFSRSGRASPVHSLLSVWREATVQTYPTRFPASTRRFQHVNPVSGPGEDYLISTAPRTTLTSDSNRSQTVSPPSEPGSRHYQSQASLSRPSCGEVRTPGPATSRRLRRASQWCLCLPVGLTSRTLRDVSPAAKPVDGDRSHPCSPSLRGPCVPLQPAPVAAGPGGEQALPEAPMLTAR